MARAVTFIAADTVRSQAYAQAIASKDLQVNYAVILRSPSEKKLPGQLNHEVVENENTNFADLFYADMSLPLETTCGLIADNTQILEVSSVNDPRVINLICSLAADLVIYSGFGGQIVSHKLLEIAPFLHVHSGWLPDYRGSTTIYYSLLQEGRCAVSAFYLKPEIDTGVIVARKYYPAPPLGFDIDYKYDNVIRADLLVSVLKDYFEKGAFENIEPQIEENATTYYKIHPVLKHLALLSLDDIDC